jgi:hypothetical protein
MQTTTRARKPANRSAKVMRLGDSLILWLTVDKNTTAYRLTPLSSDFGRAVRLQKADKGDGESEEYNVLLDGARSTCECLGYLKHGHCKHSAGLQAIITSGQLADALPEPEEEETIILTEEPPQPAKPSYCRHCGCLTSEHTAGFCPA